MSAIEKINARIAKLNITVDHHKALHWMTPIRAMLREMGVGRYLHEREEMKTHKDAKRQEEFKVFCNEHSAELKQVYDMLEDDFSRLTFEKLLDFRRTGDPKALEGIPVYPQYFQKDVFGPVEDEVFVDGGAYVGDTILPFMKYCGGGYKRIYAWEPDESNLKALKQNTKSFSNITYVPYGMWDEKTELLFSAFGTGGSRVAENAGQDIIRINVDTIDNVCAGDKVTFIKMDIEGSEQTALRGAVNVIKRDKPRLAICIYHRPDDLYKIPFWIKQTVPEYKLYLRHHNSGYAETVLYATV